MSFLSRHFPLALCAAFTLAQPALAADPAACQYLEAARVQLAYTGPGLEITMPGTINGKPARMLADTGSGRTYLTRTAVQRHGLRLRPTSERVHGIGGETMVYASKVSDFAAGPARSTAATMPVPADTGSVPSFDAIVGRPTCCRRIWSWPWAARKRVSFGQLIVTRPIWPTGTARPT